MPEVCLPEKIAVVDPEGTHLFWADEVTARALIAAGTVVMCRTKKKVRRLIARERPHELIKISPSNLVGTRYSHDHETETNVQGCWTFTSIPKDSRAVFTRVLDECLAA